MLLQISFLLISKISYAVYELERSHASFSKRKKKSKKGKFSCLPASREKLERTKSKEKMHNEQILKKSY